MAKSGKMRSSYKEENFFDNLCNVWIRMIVFSIEMKLNADESSTTTCRIFISKQSSKQA